MVVVVACKEGRKAEEGRGRMTMRRKRTPPPPPIRALWGLGRDSQSSWCCDWSCVYSRVEYFPFFASLFLMLRLLMTMMMMMTMANFTQEGIRHNLSSPFTPFTPPTPLNTNTERREILNAVLNSAGALAFAWALLLLLWLL